MYTSTSNYHSRFHSDPFKTFRPRRFFTSLALLTPMTNFDCSGPYIIYINAISLSFASMTLHVQRLKKYRKNETTLQYHLIKHIHYVGLDCPKFVPSLMKDREHSCSIQRLLSSSLSRLT